MIRFRKSSIRAVTPVIATIILIAGTLVLALVVGAYTFGLFGSNVKTVTLASATLYGGVTTDNATLATTASLTFSLNNPGSATTITSVTLTGAGLATPVTLWNVAAPKLSQSYMVGNNNAMAAGAVTPFTIYPVQSPSVPITTGQTFNYVMNFQNGQSVSGALIAQ
jgi:hypothetical protein